MYFIEFPILCCTNKTTSSSSAIFEMIDRKAVIWLSLSLSLSDNINHDETYRNANERVLSNAILKVSNENSLLRFFFLLFCYSEKQIEYVLFTR